MLEDLTKKNLGIRGKADEVERQLREVEVCCEEQMEKLSRQETRAIEEQQAEQRTGHWQNVLLRKFSMSPGAVSMYPLYHEDEVCVKREPQMTTPLRPAPPNVNALEDKAAVGGIRRPHVSESKCPGLVTVGRQFRQILFTCLSRVPSLRSCCLNAIGEDAPDLSIAQVALHCVR